VTTGLTALRFDSETGDYIGQGETQTWEPVDGNFSAARNFAEGISVDFDGLTSSMWWSLDFAASGAVELERGAYEYATRFPFNQESEPGLSISGSGRGCNTLTGTFDVLEAVDDAASLQVAPALRSDLLRQCVLEDEGQSHAQARRQPVAEST